MIPSLPALSRFQGTSDTQSLSPDNRRTDTSTYYTTAWGSPYATPSSRRLSGTLRTRQVNFDPELLDTSPFSIHSRHHHQQLASTDDHTERLTAARLSEPSFAEQLEPDNPGRSRARSIQDFTQDWINQYLTGHPRSERTNWLSDDSDSETGSFLTAHNFAGEESGWLGLDDPIEDDILKTPTSNFPKGSKKGDRSSKFGSLRSRSRHIPKKSTDTLKQSDFWDFGYDQDAAPIMSNPDTFTGAAEQGLAARPSNISPTEKPLPPPPQSEESSIPPTVPQKCIPTAPSFQRPKKRVPWRGRQCIIALPLQDSRGSTDGGFRLLSAADNEQKLKKWEDEGYHVRGYTGAQTQSQSCPTFPDPADSQQIWEDKSFTVSFPNQGEWEDYVNFLQEEKLRALGVFLGDPDPVSTNSPLSAPMSQNSSQFPGHTISPPIPASSAASNQLNMAANPFAAAFNPSIKAATSLGSFTSPTTPFGLQTSSPFQSQQGNMANDSMHPFLPFQPTPPVHNAQSPQNIYGLQQGLVSPMGAGHMANLGSLLQPVSPMASDDINQFSRPDLYQINHSMHEDPQHAYEKNGGVNMALPPVHQHGEEAEDTDTVHTPSGPEIVHPTPRGHRHNLSETLQKGIEKAEHELEEEQINKQRGDSINAQWPQPDQSFFPAQPHTQSGRLQQQLFGERGYDHGGMDDGSDIDTNPSLTASRSPIEFQGNNADTNPHQNHTGPDSSYPGHKPKNSLTNLNVSAQAFDPTSSFSPSNFSFVSNSLQMNSTDQTSQPASNRGAMQQISHSARSSGFNISAPSFTPGQNQGSVSSSTGFKFSAASFNVEAPVFNPGSSINLTSPPDDTSGPRANIFGDFDESHARPAKQSKAIPIVRPEEPDKADDNTNGGEGGRFGAQGREKRARRVGGDDDEEPVFASHAPTDADSKPTPSPSTIDVSDAPSETKGDRKRSVDTATSHPQESKQSPSPIAQQQESSTWKPFEFKNKQDAVAFNAAVPSGATADQPDSASTQTSEKQIDHQPQTRNDAVAGPSDGPSSTAQEQPSLKPTAQPFEFKAAAATSPSSPKSAQAPPQPPPKKPTGMQASRYAKSESPERVAPSNHVQEPPMHQGLVVPGDSEEDTLDEKELDAVMQQLNDDSSAGVERTYTPIPTPGKVYGNQNMPGSTAAPRLLPNEVRNNAPSPSVRGEEPPKSNTNFHIPPQSGLSSHQSIQASPRSPVRQLNSQVQEHISDWDDAVSSGEDEEFRQRTRFFDTHVDEIIGASLDDRMGPLENSLGDIQHTLSVLLSQREYLQRKPGFDEVEHSDADDEDEEEAESGARSRSPWSRGDRRIAKIKQAVLEALSTSQTPPKDVTPRADLSEINSSLAELRTAIATIPVPDESAKLKEIVTRAITNHPKFNEPEPTRDPEDSPEKLRLQIEGLQSMLRLADERTEQEYNARRSTQDILAETQRQLAATEQDVARQRETAESAEKALQEFKDAKLPEVERIEQESAKLKEQRDSWGLTLSELTEKNIGLEGTLDEYRVTADHMRTEAEKAKAENKDLRGTINILKNQMGDNMKSRHNLRERFDRLQEDMINATNDVAQDRSNWKKKEEEQVIKYNILQSQYEQEITRRQKLELHLEDLEQKEMEATKLKFILRQSQEENAKLEEVLMNVRQESHDYQNNAARFEREFNEARESSRAEIQRVRTSMESDIEAANHQVNFVRAELETQLNRLQNQLDSANMDSDTDKAKYELLLEEAQDAKVAALQDAAESKESALQDQRLTHERTLNDLRERHARALHNSSEDRRRDETHYMELLALRDEKIDHLQDRIIHMEEKLQIAKDAARAAAEAAQSAKSTPVAAPPAAHPTSPSLSFAQGSAIPDKISPQALRESIMVLQDQLQQREGRIEELEHELSTMDKDAPLKIKEKETEITWLRELLNVRIDDLQDIVKVVSRPSFDQRAVRDAAIRLKANLQMQQQEKERAMSGGGDQPFPSLASISNLAASPRALPMAAAAAWGNWRKGRESSVASSASSGPSNSSSNNRNEQATPSKAQQKSNSQSFLSGLMTPPGSNARDGSANHRHRHSGHSKTMAPLSGGARRSNSESRPLRSHITNHNHNHSTSRRRQMDNMMSPTTPPLLRTSSYDHDAEATQYGDDAYINDNDSDSVGSMTLPLESNFAAADDNPFGPAI